MTEILKEAAPIGRILGAGSKTVAWVYRWNTAEISILWLSDVRDPEFFEFVPHPHCKSVARKDLDSLLRASFADFDKN